jgi:hypothetical protein
VRQAVAGRDLLQPVGDDVFANHAGVIGFPEEIAESINCAKTGEAPKGVRLNLSELDCPRLGYTERVM